MPPSRFRAPPAQPPAWERRGEGESLDFTAVPARLWAFGVTIAVVTLCAGTAVSALAILLTPHSAREARMLIVVAALCLCLPLVALVVMPFRARTVPVTFAHAPDGVTITIGADARRATFSEVDSLLWRTGTEYARVVVNGRELRCSLLVGIARPVSGYRADLPEISSALHRALESAGLAASKTKPGLVTYRRR